MDEGVRLYDTTDRPIDPFPKDPVPVLPPPTPTDTLQPFDWRKAHVLSPEQREVLAIFTELLRGPTADGGVKRARGEKVIWKEDTSHEDAAWRHLQRKLDGDIYDEDSGYHAYIHAAWRLLAVAYQEGARLSDRKEATSLRAGDSE